MEPALRPLLPSPANLGADYDGARRVFLAPFLPDCLKAEGCFRAHLPAGPGPVHPGRDGFVPPTVGLLAAEMPANQKALLLAAIDRWVSIQPSEDAVRRMAEIEADLDGTFFAWTGIHDENARAYMRIQGPTLIIELASRGSRLGHYHTIYRNPTSEYGGLGP